MTITSAASEIEYVGDAVTVAFPIPFPFDTSADIKVVRDGVTITTGFTITGGSGSTGTCTFDTAPTALALITLIDNPEIKQDHDYTPNDRFPAESHEQALDRLTRIAKRLSARVDRSIRLPDGNGVDSDDLEIDSTFESMLLGFDADLNPTPVAPTSYGSLTKAILTALGIGSTGIEYIRTPAETAAGVTPVNSYKEPGELLRQVKNTTPGTTPCDVGFQAALDAASALDPVVSFSQEVAISKPLLLKSTQMDCLTIDGHGRVTSIINPLLADIKQAPQNVNCLFFNQKNAGNLHLKGFRCGPDAHAYTGIFMYCTEGGGGDASGQALFSAVIDDCWYSFSTNNSGIFWGGFSNLSVTKCVFESVKTACFRLEGLGNGDQQYIGNVMNACYDSFILGTDDTQTKADITVDVLHSYQHLRGPLIEAKNLVNCTFSNIIEEPDAANVGTTGILKLTDSAGITAANLTMKSRSGIPRGSCCLEFINGATGTYTNVVSDATTGIRFSGTGALDLTFIGCDFSGCDNAVQWLSGTLSGKVRFRNCKFNDSQLYSFIVSAGTMSFDLTVSDSEVMNAGLSGTATNRNVDLNTSGKVRFISTKIGKDNAGAAAASFVRAVGAGTFEIIDPIPGTTAPATAFLDPTNTQVVSLDGADSSMPGMPQFVPIVGGTATYTVQSGRWNTKGKRCFFEGQITINAIGTGSASVISGLPFASSATANANGGGYVFEVNGSSALLTAMPSLLIGTSATSATLKGFTAGAASDGTVSVMTSGTNIRFQGNYPLP